MNKFINHYQLIKYNKLYKKLNSYLNNAMLLYSDINGLSRIVKRIYNKFDISYKIDDCIRKNIDLTYAGAFPVAKSNSIKYDITIYVFYDKFNTIYFIQEDYKKSVYDSIGKCNITLNLL